MQPNALLSVQSMALIPPSWDQTLVGFKKRDYIQAARQAAGRSQTDQTQYTDVFLFLSFLGPDQGELASPAHHMVLRQYSRQLFEIKVHGAMMIPQRLW
jgi:hypothetical protein